MLELKEKKIPAEGQHADVTNDTAFHTTEIIISSLSHDQLYFGLLYIWKHSDTVGEVPVIINKLSLLLKSQKVPHKIFSR